MAGQQQKNIISFIYITGLGCGDGLLDGAKLTQSLSVVHNVISHTRRGAGGVAIRWLFGWKSVEVVLGIYKPGTANKSKML